jgi:hypothetical protein
MKALLLFPIFAAVGVIVVSLFALYRNERVYRFRTGMIAQIRDVAMAERGRPWAWRYEAYDEVTYTEMMRRFWVPLSPEAWYADTSFLREVQR